jgi:hypothetical protein
MAWIHDADKFYTNADYFNALILYQFAQNDSMIKKESVLPYEVELTNQKLTVEGIRLDSTRVIPMNQYVTHQIAMCHFYLHNYQLAEQSFKISCVLPYYETDKFHYARAMKNNENYSFAASLFEEFITKYPTDSLTPIAKLELEGCKYALEKHEDNWNVHVAMADTSVFNKGTVSMATMFFGRQNRLMFSSARKGGVILKPEQNSELLFDIYWTEKSSDSTWIPAVNFGRPLNSASHDATATITDNNVIYYTRWNDKFRKDQYIHLARMVDFKFYESYTLESPVNYPGKKSVTPFVAEDGKTLYFSSNRDGGYGGMDIWKIPIDDQGRTIGAAVNLGPEVNSQMDEICPFIHAHSNTLFFSSNGYNSIGGYDVFKAGFDSESNKFNTPVNLGKTLNSSKDDMYFIIDSLMLNGFLTSDRASSGNVYPAKIYAFSNDQILITSIGHVTGSDGKPLAKAKVEIKDVTSSLEPIFLETDVNGKFTTNLPFGYEFYIETQLLGYIPNAMNFSTKNYSTAQTVVLEKIQMEKK